MITINHQIGLGVVNWLGETALRIIREDWVWLNIVSLYVVLIELKDD